MKRTSIPMAILLAAGAALLVLGCASPKPFDYHSGNEIPEGPGLFSGKDGAVTLYDSNKAPGPAGRTESGSGTHASSADGPAPAVTPANQAAFREFQQWQKEREDFEAFQQWKHSRKGTAEYREFRDWLRWQEYKQWQESQAGNR